MGSYISGESRTQSTLFPDVMDDYIHEDNPVRVVDVFVDELDLQQLGFLRSVPKQTGRPGYSPNTMLKLYLYGYLNRIQSSRRLEKEAQRNVELMWLLQRLAPDFKTIADFRKDNGEGIKNSCRAFVQICRKLNLFTDSIIAVDGSKFKAVNSKDKNYTQTTIKRKIDIAEKHIEQYLTELDQADQEESPHDQTALQEKVNYMKQHLVELRQVENTISHSEVKQLSVTDPDCRSMKASKKGTIVGYNVQSAVDTKHHLIVSHYVTNRVVDRHEIFKMGEQVQTDIGRRKVTLIADAGYYSGQHVKACQDAGMTTLVKKGNSTSGSQKTGLYSREEFSYIPEKDAYLCPAGEEIRYSSSTIENRTGKRMRNYLHVMKCIHCKVRSQCTPSKARKIARWEHQGVLDEMANRLKSMPDAMHIRKITVEHPFGTIKSWMGATHFLTKRLLGVNTEMNLHVLAYNMKRMINIMGQDELIEAIRGST